MHRQNEAKEIETWRAGFRGEYRRNPVRVCLKEKRLQRTLEVTRGVGSSEEASEGKLDGRYDSSRIHQTIELLPFIASN